MRLRDIQPWRCDRYVIERVGSGSTQPGGRVNDRPRKTAMDGRREWVQWHTGHTDMAVWRPKVLCDCPDV